MKSVKWLYSLFFALTFTLCVEIAGVFAVREGIEWYAELQKPAFVTPPVTHSVLWCVVYLAEAYVVAQLLVSNKIKPFIFNYLFIKLFAALWTVCFFVLKSPLLALVIITVILTLNFVYFNKLLKTPTHRFKSAVFLPVLGWYCYLWILNYCIALLN